MLRNQKGQALLLVLLLTTVIFMIGGAALALSTVARKNAIQETWQKKAYYIAEAGIEMALADLRQRLIYPAPGFEEFSIHNMSYAGGAIEEVQVTKDIGESDIYTITSSSRYPEGSNRFARKSIRVKVKVVPDPFLSYGGPGLKSDDSVKLKSLLPLDLGITNTGGSFLARTGDVLIEVLFGGSNGGIYAGGNVYLPQGISTGKGEIKAGGDVDLGEIIGTWNGEIWAGKKVDPPFINLGKITIHENCGSYIQGFPLPCFPVVYKHSEWYERVKDGGHFFDNIEGRSAAERFLDDRIRWNEHTLEFSVPLLGDYCFVYFLPWDPPSLILTGIDVIDGPLNLNASSVQEAYKHWKDSYKKMYPNKNMIFFDDISTILEPIIDVIKRLLKFDPFQPAKLKVIVDSGATIVADKIEIDEGLIGLIGIDTSGINGPFGLFAVGDPDNGEGDVIYKAIVGAGGRLSVIATGKFDCSTAGNLNLDWVAAKDDVVINAIINLNAAQAKVPPGTPVGYRIVAWE